MLLTPVFLRGESRADQLERVILSLEKNSVPYEKRSLLADYGGFGSSLIVRNANVSLARGTFVLAVPLDAEFAVDTALILAEKIQLPYPDPEKAGVDSANILVAFLGDEKNELPAGMGGISHKGLRDLLSLADMPENWVLCYLDTGEAPRELVIQHGIRGYVAPLDIVKPLPGLFRAGGIPWSFRIRYNEIYKLGLVEGPDALYTAWGEEINGFVLSGGEPRIKNGLFSNARGDGPESETVSAENLAELFLSYSASLDFPVFRTDRHYSSFSGPGGKVFFLSEGLTVAILMITAGILLFVFLVYSAKYNAILIFHIRLFFRFSWIFIIFLPLMLLAVKVSGELYSLLLKFLRPEIGNAPPGTANYPGAALTVILAALFFFLPSPLLHFIHFPRRGRFYGFSAVIFVTIGMFSAAFLDFSYVPVFLWAFFFVIPGAALSGPVFIRVEGLNTPKNSLARGSLGAGLLIFLCALLVPFFALGVLQNIIATGSGIIAELFISSPWNTRAGWLAAFQFSLLALPVFLLAKRGTILIQKSSRMGREPTPDRKYRLIVVPILLAVVLGAMAAQILLIPKAGIPPERRFVNDESRTGTDAVLELDFDDTIFQDSRIITLRVEGRGRPLRFDVSLESSGAETLLPLYSAAVPFERENEGKRIKFLLGENPPNPLVMEIVVPLKFDGILKAEAVYNTWQGEVDSGEKPASGDYVLRVVRTAGIGALLP